MVVAMCAVRDDAPEREADGASSIGYPPANLLCRAGSQTEGEATDQRTVRAKDDAVNRVDASREGRDRRTNRRRGGAGPPTGPAMKVNAAPRLAGMGRAALSRRCPPARMQQEGIV